MMDPRVRHTAFSKHIKDFFNRGLEFASQELQGRFPKSYTKYFTRDAVVKKATNLQRVSSKFFMNIARTKIGKGGLIAAGSIIGWNLIQHAFKSINPQPAIPRNYDRGYDLIKENLTDFGSPVNLAKAANKTITPYKSAVRRGTYTTTRTIRNHNLALSLSDNAIKHHHY